MSASDLVIVNVSVSGGSSPTRQGFGVPLVAAYHTHYNDRIRFYPTATFGTAMVADGFLTTEPAYKAAAIMAAQNPAPTQIAIGRRANKPLQTLTLTCTSAITGDVYNITLVGSTGISTLITFTVPGASTTTSVATAILALINAIANVATTIGVATSAAAVITITRSDGALTDLQLWTQNLQIADTTADPGITADLVAIQAANTTGWYTLSLDSNSTAEVQAAAAWTESTGVGGKFGCFNNSDNADVTGATTDVFSVLKTNTYKRCFIEYNGSKLLCYAGAAAAAILTANNPGSISLAYKSQASVPADSDTTLTETQALILNTLTAAAPGSGGKNGNYYKTQAGLNILWPGITPSGSQWVDTTIGVDWLQVNCQADVIAALASLPKPPYNDFGIGLVKDALDTRLRIGASPAYNIIDPTQPIVVTVPLAASIPAATRATRNLTGVSATAKLAGAIITTTIQINLTQ